MGSPVLNYLWSPKRRRSGVTILELLIATTSITTLTSLVLPALSASREAGRNRQCEEHLHQIGVALQSFAESDGAFPAGWNMDASNNSGYGWAATILPQMNEEVLSRQLDRSRPVGEVSRAVRTSTPAIYLCPSDYGASSFCLFAELGAPGANAQKSTLMLVTLPRANYVGIFGTSEPDEVAGNSGDGMFVEGRGFRSEEISRGLSRVLLVGERTTRKLSSTWLGVAMAGEDAGGRIVGNAYEGPNRDDTDECELDSRHYGHVNFVWADGHVSGVEDDIDLQVYRQCAQRR
jgi:prepilin-type processing-associated H-X9-DG protein